MSEEQGDMEEKDDEIRMGVGGTDEHNKEDSDLKCAQEDLKKKKSCGNLSEKSEDSSESQYVTVVNKSSDSDHGGDSAVDNNVRPDKGLQELAKGKDSSDPIIPENIQTEIEMLQDKIDAIRNRQATLKEETKHLVQQFDELLEHYKLIGGEVLDIADVSL